MTRQHLHAAAYLLSGVLMLASAYCHRVAGRNWSLGGEPVAARMAYLAAKMSLAAAAMYGLTAAAHLSADR